MTRRRIGGLMVIAGACGLVALLFRNDDQPTKAPAPVGRRPTPTRVAPKPLPLSPAPIAPAPGAEKPASGSVAPASTKDLTNEEIKNRIAAGEAGMNVLGSRLPQDKVPVTARWQVEDEWTVETYYLQMQSPEQNWAGPARWRFRIEREVSFKDQPCYEISVVRDDEEGEPGVFYVSKSTYSLVGQESTVTQGGKKQRVTFSPDDKGAQSAFSNIPFDLPPAGTEAHATTATVAPPLAKQKDKAARALTPRDEELAGAEGGLVDLEYSSPKDGTTIRQKWAKNDARWPVISRTATTLSIRRK